jgi:hypothetical protein
MRPVPGLIVALFFTELLGITASADLRPADGAAPVFRVFAAGPANASGAPTINISGKPPLMIISAAADVQLSTDRKAVRLTLTSSDARKFGDITRRHIKDFLVIEANGRVLEVMQVTSPVTNGMLEFTYPEDAAVADYLRKRFRIK